MPLRIPPGRTGRLWLARRLALAERGAELLDEKRQALLNEQRRLKKSANDARQEWEASARTASTWLNRALLTAGRRQLELALIYGAGKADVRVSWRRALGIRYPDETGCVLPDPLDVSGLGAGSALAYAAEAHRRAVEAALRFGAAQIAFLRVSRELEATIRRLRAIEKRWVPRFKEALAARELQLDEFEREDAARNRWATRRLAGRLTAHPSLSLAQTEPIADP